VVMFDFPLNALDYLHRSGRTARGVLGDRQGNGRVTALVSKRDKVLANGIENAVSAGEPLDGLSSRKSDYLPGGRIDQQSGRSSTRGGSGGQKTSGGGDSTGRLKPKHRVSSSKPNSSSNNKKSSSRRGS
jgi:superfamily II DNA/RNA helicase